MADGSNQDAVAKQRIITHMNADHQDSVVRYVEHLKGASSASARRANIIDMTLDQITISNGGTKWHIALEPPMVSWRDARERLVQMDQDALKALNRSEISVKQYRAPRGVHLVIFLLCLVGYVSFLRKEFFAPGSFLYRILHPYMPTVVDLIRETYPLGLVLMVGIHAVEATLMARTRLVKHSVPTLSLLWWKWMTSSFLEGYGAFQRLDALVEESRAEKQKRKH